MEGRESQELDQVRRGTTPVAFVAGGGQGIGRGVAELLLRRGWHVHVNVRDEAKRAGLERDLPGAVAHSGDLLDPEAVGAAVEAVVAQSGRLDAVVHAAGPYMTAPVSESTAADFRGMFDGNVITALNVIHAARPHLRASKGSYLFFGCAGLERWRAREVTTAYIASKAALLTLMRGLSLEEAPFGVRANMISPGFVPHGGAAPDTLSPDLHERIPLGRPAEMPEVTGAAAWLLSEEASHVVGQNLEVSGGWML